MKSKSGASKKKLLLVAEDDEAAGSIVCEALGDAGYKTFWVKDGIEALNYVLESRPDGIVLGTRFTAAHTGAEICGMVRKSRAIQWTPIIVMSGRAEHCDKMQAFELGADDYVIKPFRLEELVARIDAVLHRNSERAYPTPFLTSSSYNA